MAAHKIVVEALERLRFDAFLESLSEDSRNVITKLANDMLRLFPSQAFDEVMVCFDIQTLNENYQKFCTERSSSSATFAFWQTYIELVTTLLDFISCTRNSDWEGHLELLARMTPWLLAYDRVNYARYVTAYLKEMNDLKQTHPFWMALFGSFA